MGSAYTWLAMKDASADEACEALGLVRCGGTFDFPETEYSGAALPKGWYVVVVNTNEFEYFMNFGLGKLSGLHDLVVVEVFETIMSFRLAYWRGGARLWEVIHNGHDGVYHLDAEGELPADFDSLRLEQVAKQDAEGGEDAEVDCLSEVPLELARRITGFGYNLRYDAGEEPIFEELAVSDDADETSGSEEPDSREASDEQPPRARPQPRPAQGPPPSGGLVRRLRRWLGGGS